MNLSQFLKESITGNINEAFQNKDLQQAIALTKGYLRKKSYEVWSFGLNFDINGHTCICVPVRNPKTDAGALIVWIEGEERSGIHSIVFTNDLNSVLLAYASDAKVNGIEVEVKGSNTIQCIKLIENVLTGKINMDAASIKTSIKGSQMYESIINESSDLDDIKRRRHNVGMRLRKAKREGKDYQDLQAQYDELTAEWNDARVSVRNVVVTKSESKTISKWEEYLASQAPATPEERFDDMQSYVRSVVDGRRPLALLCGAPGVGKTFRVMKTVKSYGLEMNSDYHLLKGKCTPTALYKALYDYKDEGQTIIYDDCDSIFKDDDAINLIKAAYDSSDERWVSWNTAAAIPMDTEMGENSEDAIWNDVKSRWEYPKQFLYKGGGIIITNFRAGQIDTAIRNRALICDLDFSTEEVLGLIEGIIPKLNCDEKSASQAITFLRKLVDLDAPLEISIRSFLICAGEYSTGASVSTCERRIVEQMKNLAARGGKKY